MSFLQVAIPTQWLEMVDKPNYIRQYEETLAGLLLGCCRVDLVCSFGQSCLRLAEARACNVSPACFTSQPFVGCSLYGYSKSYQCNDLLLPAIDYLLVTKQVSPNYSSSTAEEGGTPLMAACAQYWQGMFDRLMELPTIDLEVHNKQGWNQLKLLCVDGFVGQTVLTYLAATPKPVNHSLVRLQEAISRLAERGADLDEKGGACASFCRPHCSLSAAALYNSYLLERDKALYEKRVAKRQNRKPETKFKGRVCVGRYAFLTV